MSASRVITKTILSADQLPILPETCFVEPIVQCGVLYLGTALSNPDLCGLDSIQEPFSHRYPVDGTNTVRGIDAILSVYDNGIQLAFTRQPRAVIFFPITSLIYCASLRFTIIENDQTKATSMIDWRFMPLSKSRINENKHPPLFCAVIRRTQILSRNECHCFITKSIDTAFALVRTISQICVNLEPKTKYLKSPIFYQLDCFGRKLREITGVIYISPAKNDDSQLNRTNRNRSTNESITRRYLFKPSSDGFFYRTDASLIERWQLWDNDDSIGSRPHPPASPFGLHEGLYHDDTTQEIQRYLRYMNNDEHSCSCSCSSEKSSSVGSCSAGSCSSRSCSGSSMSTEYSRRQRQHLSKKQKSFKDTDQFNISLSNLKTSSFEPVLRTNNTEIKKKRRAPIIIEKVAPKPIQSAPPILKPKLPRQPLNLSNSQEKSKLKYIPSTDFPSNSYRINKHGEKITKEGNRIVFMDVVRPTINKDKNDIQQYISSTSRSRSHRQRSSRPVPVFDIETIERFYEEKKSNNQRRTSRSSDEKLKDDSNHMNHLPTQDKSEIIDENKINLNNHEVQPVLNRETQFLHNYEAQPVFNHSELSNKNKQQDKFSIISLTTSSTSGRRQRRSDSVASANSSMNYEKRPSIPSLSKSQGSSTVTTVTQKPFTPPILTDEQVNTYISNIYGTAKSDSSSSINQQQTQPLDNTAVINTGYISAFRYMQSSVNHNILQAYHNAY